MSLPRPNAFRRVSHPLRLTTRHGWRWGRDPRNGARLVLISPGGIVFECRRGATGLVARRYQDFQLA